MSTEKDNHNNNSSSRLINKEWQDKEARSISYFEEIKNAIMINGLIKISMATIN
jgi:hypothetical protein